jgi:hypothetical protein
VVSTCMQSGQQPPRSNAGTTSPEQFAHESRARSWGLYQDASSSTSQMNPFGRGIL